MTKREPKEPDWAPEFRVTIPGRIGGKGRPRFTKGRVYTDAKTAADEKKVGMLAKIAMGPQKPLDGPLTITVEMYLNTPKGWTKADKEAAWHVYGKGHPDLDNILKLILDSLNGVVFIDDSQICSIWISRIYRDDKPEAVEIRIFTPGTGWQY